MMRKIFILVVFLISLWPSQQSQAQNVIWLAGSSVLDDQASYGTMGIEAASNKPGSRREFLTLTDASGGMWLFGGYGRTTGPTIGYLNDLWKFNPVNNQWTWVSGTNLRNQLGNYGAQLTPSTTNRPGSRRWAAGWADNSGNLYIFGGFGYGASGSAGRLNDLWKYNTATNEWTWLSGSNFTNQTGDYTTVGALRPGARSRSTAWTDGTDGWIFAGDGYTSTILGQLNDLWRYNSATNTWTFLKGDNAGSVAGVYGTQGTANPANKPSAREYGVGWYTPGSLYLFGGDAGSTFFYNDLWKYDIASGDWTWMKGSNLTNQTGTYGTFNIPDASNNPGARQQAMGFKDLQGRLFLMYGYG
jgi:N-acetylneuraminic acid mutarotase